MKDLLIGRKKTKRSSICGPLSVLGRKEPKRSFMKALLRIYYVVVKDLLRRYSDSIKSLLRFD